ncbi:PREDICTED: zinc finger protein 91-like [Drosophila arizonae]|uniref:Zinc finger protein 91-like n=4 Tax=mojavensis species complex TaxID=198037 RepID=A0ABM1P5N7_DROAR|nr:PREDICTED: zinc finger protein 91-like [Drosophila arizonae]
MDERSEYSIQTICRICLNHLRNDAAYDLFLVPGLAKKLCVCTSLSVEQNDGFPMNLCTSCYTRLNDLHDFQKLCVDSVQRFQEMIASNFFAPAATQANQIDNFDVLNVATQEGELVGEEEDRINYDPLLNHKMEIIENEEDVFKMLEHVDKEAEEAEKEIKHDVEEQPGVLQMFGDESSMESSNENDHDNDNDIDFEPNSTDGDDDMPLAQRLRGNPRNLSKSGAKTPSDSVQLEDDYSSASETNGSKTRIKRKRIPAAERHLHRIIDCHICHQKFKKAIRYEEHMKHHNDLLPFQCKVESCRKGFTTAGGLRLHVDHAHTELSEVHACSVEGCGKTFPRIRLLTFHMKKVHNISKAAAPPRDYPCTECEKVFRCPMALKKHMYKHDGKELPFPCNICGKRFVINSALKDHLMRHAGIKNYVCPYCGVGKTTRQEWNTHILTHTQEKKFKCHICEHASHNKQSLANHIKIVHEKIKNYACQYCGKTFGKSHACKIHEMTHTGEKRCECKVCGKKFLYPKSLTKHLKTHEKRVLRAIETYRQRQVELGEVPTNSSEPTDVAAAVPAVETSTTTDGVDVIISQNAADELLKVCAESVATIPRDPRRVQRVDIAQLAGTAVNPIPSVSVPSWSPQVNFTKKEGKHICPGCGQGFNNIGNMKRHYKIIHEKVKDFACRFCPKRFAKAQTLRHHEWIHTGEKPFECKTCGTHFRQETALKRHQRTHENRPPVISSKFYAAREELEEQERTKREARRQAEAKRKEIAEAAKEQLSSLHKIEATDKNLHSYDEYQEAAAERAAASAELQAQQFEENEQKRRADMERLKIQEAAYEQLQKLQKQQEIEKAQSSYDGYYAQKASADGTSLEDLKIDHV